MITIHIVGVHNTDYAVNIDAGFDSAADVESREHNGSSRHISEETGASDGTTSSPLHRTPLERRNTLTRIHTGSISRNIQYKTSRALHVNTWIIFTFSLIYSSSV